MDIDLVVRDAEVVHREHCDAGKSFVHFEQVDIGDGPARLGKAFGDRTDRSGGEGRWFLRMRGKGNDARNRGVALGIGDRLTRQDKCGCSIRDGRAGRSGNGAVLGESGAQARDLVGHALAGLFVGVDDHIALAGGNSDGDDFVLERAIGNRGLRTAERFNCVIILRLTRQLIFVCGILREGAHGTARFIGIFQTVEEHMVIGGVMADACAATMLFQQIGGVGHAFHATGDDIIDRSSGESLAAHDDGLHTRTAYLVDGGGLHRLG